MAKFCDRLRSLRTSKGLSQYDFSKQIGISKSSVNMYERGEREPTEAERKKLEAELGIELLDTGSDADSLQQGGVAATTLGDVLQVKRK